MPGSRLLWYVLSLTCFLPIPRLQAQPQQPTLWLNQDTVELGEPLRLVLYPADSLAGLVPGMAMAPWELWQVQVEGDSLIFWLLGFEPGLTPLPPLPFGSQTGPDTLLPEQSILIRSPLEGMENPSPLPLKPLIEAPRTWLEPLPWFLIAVGGGSWLIIWSVFLTGYFRSRRRNWCGPPPSPFQVARKALDQTVTIPSPEDRADALTQIFRKYLQSQFQLPAHQLEDPGPFLAGYPELVKAPSWQALIDQMTAWQPLRFSGQPLKKEEVSAFFDHLLTFLKLSRSHRVEDEEANLQRFGRPTSAFRQWLAGGFDWLPPTLLVAGGWLLLPVLPSFPAHQPWEHLAFWIWIAAALGTGLLIRTGVAFLTEPSPAQATPGKWILSIRVVATQGEPLRISQGFVRALAWLISTLPLGLGHLTAWLSGRRTWHDLWAGTELRTYPRKTT